MRYLAAVVGLVRILAGLEVGVGAFVLDFCWPKPSFLEKASFLLDSRSSYGGGLLPTSLFEGPSCWRTGFAKEIDMCFSTSMIHV